MARVAAKRRRLRSVGDSGTCAGPLVPRSHSLLRSDTQRKGGGRTWVCADPLILARADPHPPVFAGDVPSSTALWPRVRPVGPLTVCGAWALSLWLGIMLLLLLLGGP